MIGGNKLSLFNFFGGKKAVELDKVKSDENKNRMREIFDRQVDNGIKYRVTETKKMIPSPKGVISFGAENASFFY